MTRPLRISVCAALLFLASTVLGARTAAAQAVPTGSPKPGTLGGVVIDTLGRPLVDADVYLRQLKKRVRTGTDGTFLFDSVKAGTYEVSARASGYLVETKTIVVSARGGFLPFQLARTGANLPSVVTVAEAGGLSGVIGDTAYTALADVEVHAVGTLIRVRTDSLGRFLLPLPAGSYLVELKRPGYWRQTLSVTIPEGGGRRIAAWLAPVRGNQDAKLSANLFEMNQRLVRAVPARTKYYTREDMAKMPAITELRQLATLTATGFVSDDCTVLVDGGPTVLPIWALSTDDIEFVEAYLTKLPVPKTTKMPSAKGATVAGAGGGVKLTSTSMIPEAGKDCGHVAMVVWLRN